MFKKMLAGIGAMMAFFGVMVIAGAGGVEGTGVSFGSQFLTGIVVVMIGGILVYVNRHVFED